MIRRYCFLIIAATILFTSLVYAFPFPWAITNISAEGNSTLIRDENGQILSEEFRVHIVADFDGDGIDPPSYSAGSYGMPTDDDILVFNFTSFPAADESIPSGGFLYELMMDTEVELYEDATQYYVRVFNELIPSQDARFAESQLFLNPDANSPVQTMLFPDRMYGYLGNDPQILTLNPATVTIQPGDEATTVISSTDPDSLFFWAVYQGNPGLEDLVRFEYLDFNEVAVSWVLPVDAPDNNILEIFSSDGQLTVSENFEVNISGNSDLPTAFHLVSPENEKTAFDNLPFVWNQSFDGDGEDIVYNFIFATEADFSDADSLTGLTDTTAYLSFDAALGVNTISSTLINTRGEKSSSKISGKNKKSALRESGTSSNKSQTLNNPGQLIELNPGSVAVDVVEGQTVYWKVHAYNESGEGRPSIDTWSSPAEIPTAPNAFDPIAPDNGIVLEDLTPAFSWEEATDSDVGDLITYDLIWSVDDFTNADTITGIVTNSYDFSDPSLLAVGGSPFANSIVEYLQNLNNELDDFPENITIQWFVDAVDIPGLRTSSGTADFSIAISDAPMPFDLAYPANETVFHGPAEIILRWTPSADNDPDSDLTYSLVWTDDPALTIPEDFDNVVTGITETHYILETPETDDIVIRWTVSAVSGTDITWANAGENGYFSFAISRPQRPNMFNLISPENDALVETLTPTLDWEAAIDPDIESVVHYSLYWSIDNWETADSLTELYEHEYMFDEPSTDQIQVNLPGSKKINNRLSRTQGRSAENETHITNPFSEYLDELDEFDDNITVSWKVRAQDNNSVGRWCSPNTGWSFDINVEYPPTAFNLIAPDSAAVTMDTLITFAWESSVDPDSLGAVTYTFILADNPDFDDSITVTLLDTTQQTDTGELEPGTYWWYVTATDNNDMIRRSNQTWSFDEQANLVGENSNALPKDFAIHSVYPNPFNPTLNVVMAVPQESRIEIAVYDILGRQTKRLPANIYSAGYPRIILDFTNNASGNYFIQMRNHKGEIFRQKVTLVK